MTRPFNKKHFWLAVGVVAVLEAIIICLAMQWKYLFPTREVGELYARYAEVEGIEASFIKDYKVNDSVFVDVTVIEAITDSAWAVLKDDFKLPVLPKEYERLAEAMSIDVWRAPRSNPYALITKRSPDDYIVAVSRPKRTVYVFDTQNDIESNAVKINKYSTFIK